MAQGASRHRRDARRDRRGARPASGSKSRASRIRARSSRRSASRDVLTAEPHPQADKLQVLTVDAGDGEPLQVVCGAPNARAGLVGVLGLPGAVVPANGMVLKVAAVRGVESNGMMCSTRELELGDDHDGIIELPADAPVGTSFRRLCRSQRSGVRRLDHAQPSGLHGRARHRARSGGGRAGHAQAARRVEPVPGEGPGPEVRTEAIPKAARPSSARPCAASPTAPRPTGCSSG